MAHILIVEDDQVLNDAYKLILTKEGHEVKVAHDGVEGLKCLKGYTPDVILLDLLMPNLDGIGFLKKYQKTYSDRKDTKVVILTNLDQDKEIQAALELGAYKYIVKARTSPKQLAINVNHLVNRNIDKRSEDS